MSRPKEPNFFSDDDIHAQGMAWYSQNFADAPAGFLRGESSTHYTKLPTYPRTLSRIQSVYGTDLKLIYIMRHPVDRLVSHYVHEWTQEVISTPLALAIQTHPALVDYGCYAMQLKPWLRAFGPERILPIFFDSLRQRPQHELDRVGAFLGARHPLVWQPDHANENVSQQRLRLPAWVRAAEAIPPLRAMQRVLVPSAVREKMKQRWQLTERPNLDPELRTLLERRFDSDLQVLGAWLSLPLNCQNFKQITESAEPQWAESAPRPAPATDF
jgi:hypothetical protein